ncbi:hypothetical protein BX616_006393 [Lobosporangium transversale]|uniref:Transmembrane protein 198 n=1 Tax=Lobosporangium transversale TaxID=64571 RepID=A0A1Y2GXT2_9FUNG|nr:hypothetical protein BCR41DRAFT_385116 [Lobosporangium transversale]KAF9915327.1 hypothetical protein BX616_006393 [Lobosporangium transversale]ORZ22843.1 hypothetical protein BCR41DRAFT_385116 [Lobosporangium transversale]|eukprot:XP_021883397.1 hypothetical protein BCR41DRAFT_385116 [Lobosporangium transversale]
MISTKSQLSIGFAADATNAKYLVNVRVHMQKLCRLLLLLLISLSCTFAIPTTVTPINDGIIDLDIGQLNRISKQNWALGVTFILIGLFEVFYGFKFIRLTLFVTGFLAWAVAAMMIMLAIRWDLIYTTFIPKYYYFWLWLAAGLVGSILSFRFWDLGVTFTGAFGGFALAMSIVAIANLSITNAGRYVIMGSFILGGAALATFFERFFIIFSTSFGGAYIFMFGVDQFAQVGYREMIVIFDFTGKTFTYHPSWDVYLMLGFSLILAGLGIGWEFWHHSAPLLMDRKALFRIYGRPFGKRPRELIGQKIHHCLKAKSDLYAHIFSCHCFHRWTIDDVLYNEEDLYGVCIPVSDGSPATVPTAPTAPFVPNDGPTKEPKPSASTDSGNTDVPPKPAPVSKEPERHIDVFDEKSEAICDNSNGTESQYESAKHDTESGHDCTGQKESTMTMTTKTITSVTFEESYSTDRATDPEESQHLELHHPLFSPHVGDRTMAMLRLVTENRSSGNTIPRNLLRGDFNRVETTVTSSAGIETAKSTRSGAWYSSISDNSDIESSTNLTDGLGHQIPDVSDNYQDSADLQESDDFIGDDTNWPQMGSKRDA